MANFNWPINPTTVSSGPLSFVKDGATTQVTLDTVTPANSEPLPVVSLDSTGNVVDPATAANQVTGNASLASIDGKTPALVSGRTPVDGSGVVQPVRPAPDVSGTFNLNGLGQTAELTNLSGQDTWTIYVSSVSSGGQMICFGSPDPTGVAYQSVPATNVATGVTNITISDVGLYRVNIAGFSKVRLEVTALPSGQITGIHLASFAPGAVTLNSPLPNGTNTIGTVNIAGTVPLPTGAATEATLAANGTLIGAVNETAPATDTASSGLNGRLQRIAQRLTSLIGLFPTSLGQKTSANSFAVVLSSDQSTLPTRVSSNSAGNSPGSATVSTVETLTVPANAVGFILMNLDTSSANIRYRIGAAASTTSGQQLQPGRDTGFIPCAANISIIAESGTQNYDIQWVLSQ